MSNTLNTLNLSTLLAPYAVKRAELDWDREARAYAYCTGRDLTLPVPVLAFCRCGAKVDLSKPETFHLDRIQGNSNYGYEPECSTCVDGYTAEGEQMRLLIAALHEHQEAEGVCQCGTPTQERLWTGVLVCPPCQEDPYSF